MFLFTPLYYQGTQNALAAFGYNRDGKKGKLQIVIGLLCDEAGHPVSIEMFPGNTQDPHPFAAQLNKVKARFGVTEITSSAACRSKRVSANSGIQGIDCAVGAGDAWSAQHPLYPLR